MGLVWIPFRRLLIKKFFNECGYGYSSNNSPDGLYGVAVFIVGCLDATRRAASGDHGGVFDTNHCSNGKHGDGGNDTGDGSIHRDIGIACADDVGSRSGQRGDGVPHALG